MEGFLVSWILTIFGYLLVPILVILKGKKYPKKKLKRIVIINGVVVWLIFSIIIINAGGDSAGASVLLYSYIGYWLLKKKCLEEPVEKEDTQNENGIDK